MPRKTAIIILSFLAALVGLFFIYLFMSGLIVKKTPAINAPASSQPAMTAEQIEKARRVKSLLEKIQAAPQGTTTPEEKAAKVESLLEKIETAPVSTTTPEAKAARVKSLLEKINGANQ
jgi:hypothetical protein